MTLLVVIGNGGHAKSVMEVAGSLAEYQLCQVSFYDSGEVNLKSDQLAFINSFSASEVEYIIAVGSIDMRAKISKSNFCQHRKAAKVVSPDAFLSSDVEIAEGSVVMPGSILRVGVKVGKHSIINTSAVLDHDVQVGNYVNISPNVTVCGNATIASHVFIGASATVIDNVSIATNILLGAGALATEDITMSGLYLGVPARRN
jgi:acetyltransferase EpsM